MDTQVRDVNDILRRRFWLLNNIDWFLSEANFYRDHKNFFQRSKIDIWQFGHDEGQGRIHFLNEITE